MNDHLIKNLKLKVFWNLFWNILIFSGVLYLINSNTDMDMDWYSIPLILFFSIFYLFKDNKIILEILQNHDEITIISYSIIKGRKKLILNINEIIKLDFYKGFVIKYKNSSIKTTETFQINAEPWNNIYEQIKRLKLKVQDFEKQKKENVNLATHNS
ncbi:hypothetical protein AAFN75_17150 [Algibacter sp. AS12]|uniref:hypothetical protein n=1 Tax=Algibacter sp. AS12 TaxID=3135773 RepID=UPI00398B776D